MSDENSNSAVVSAPTPSRAELRRKMIQALAAAECVPPDEIEARVGKGGDIEIDSKLAEVVIARIEGVFGGRELVKAADLRPDQLTSLDTLTDLLLSGMKSSP
jgi:hypothetical protein